MKLRASPRYAKTETDFYHLEAFPWQCGSQVKAQQIYFFKWSIMVIAVVLQGPGCKNLYFTFKLSLDCNLLLQKSMIIYIGYRCRRECATKDLPVRRQHICVVVRQMGYVLCEGVPLEIMFRADWKGNNTTTMGLSPKGIVTVPVRPTHVQSTDWRQETILVSLEIFIKTF